MFNIILFGPPGSGKGTQATSIEEKYKLHHVSTGDLFRYELKNNTEVGKQIQKFLDSGQLVPDEITIKMLKNKILSYSNPNGFLLDGFPRNIAQADALIQLFKELDSDVHLLVSLDVPEEEIVARILNRGKTSGRSDDNDESVIRGRYKVYEEVTDPVFEYFGKMNKASKVDGIGTIEEIFGRIVDVIDRSISK
ncbi:MAG: adenylate kinase [Deltaproteobacteria bacterium]